MPSQLTYSGSTGPGQALTTALFTDVTELNYDLPHKTLKVVWGIPSITTVLSLSASTTVTHTISGGNHTVTIS